MDVMHSLQSELCDLDTQYNDLYLEVCIISRCIWIFCFFTAIELEDVTPYYSLAGSPFGTYTVPIQYLYSTHG